MLFEFVDLARGRLVGVLVGSGLPSGIFWLYFSGSVLLVVGLVKILKGELSQLHGLDKIMPFGRLFLAMPLAVFGTEHLTNAAGIATIVPRWLPANTFWVYLVGIALIAAALSITLQIQSALAATLLGAMLVSFVLLIHIPNILANAGNRILWAVGLRDISFSGGAFAYAGAHRRSRGARGVPGLVTVGRFFVAIPAVFFWRGAFSASGVCARSSAGQNYSGVGSRTAAVGLSSGRGAGLGRDRSRH
jgi:uncharacterized membrane protein YphA (DoxX/SURF4 family)